MPITLEKLFSLTVPVTFPYMGEDVTVVFAPARYTGEMQEWSERMVRENADVLAEIDDIRVQKETAEDRLKLEAAKPEPNRDVIADLVTQVRDSQAEIDTKQLHLSLADKAAIRQSLATLLVSWDVLDGKTPIGTDVATLNTLPDAFLYAVFTAMQGENQQDPPKAPTSDEPSTKAETSAPSPTGTSSSPARARSASRRSSSTNAPAAPVTTPSGAPGQ